MTRADDVTKHSPTPWSWNVGRPERYDLIWITDATGKRVLTMYGPDKLPKDMKHITRCVNAHDALVEAIGEALIFANANLPAASTLQGKMLDALRLATKDKP